MKSLENVAVVSPHILTPDRRIWYAGRWISSFGGLSVFNYRSPTVDSTPTVLIETHNFHNCFMVRLRALEMVMGFDSTRFPMHLAKADLSERLRRLGYRVVVNPAAEVTDNIETRCSKRILGNVHITEPIRAHSVSRNRILYMRRHRNQVQFHHLPPTLPAGCRPGAHAVHHFEPR